jgi:hypothetical protein
VAQALYLAYDQRGGCRTARKDGTVIEDFDLIVTALLREAR